MKESSLSDWDFPAGNKKFTILIVEDDDIVREFLSEILSGAGYTTICIDNGEKAVDLARENEVKLVLTDIVMPGKEGLEVIREIKKELPQIKIISMSGAAQKADYLNISRYFGVDATMPKPFKRDDVLKTVAELAFE